jgi:hypothetical protein
LLKNIVNFILFTRGNQEPGVLQPRQEESSKLIQLQDTRIHPTAKHKIGLTGKKEQVMVMFLKFPEGGMSSRLTSIVLPESKG